jgi:hypothetical protein
MEYSDESQTKAKTKHKSKKTDRAGGVAQVVEPHT